MTNLEFMRQVVVPAVEAHPLVDHVEERRFGIVARTIFFVLLKSGEQFQINGAISRLSTLGRHPRFE